jgi:hypothetical protein
MIWVRNLKWEEGEGSRLWRGRPWPTRAIFLACWLDSLILVKTLDPNMLFVGLGCLILMSDLHYWLIGVCAWVLFLSDLGFWVVGSFLCGVPSTLEIHCLYGVVSGWDCTILAHWSALICEIACWLNRGPYVMPCSCRIEPGLSDFLFHTSYWYWFVRATLLELLLMHECLWLGCLPSRGCRCWWLPYYMFCWNSGLLKGGLKSCKCKLILHCLRNPTLIYC